MEDVLVREVRGWWYDVRLPGKRRRVPGRSFPTGLAPAGQVGELGEQNGRLEGVESAVRPNLLVMVLLGTAVQPERPEPRRQVILLGDHHPPVPEATQVFTRKKREGTAPAEFTGHPPGPVHQATSADGLRAIFDDREPMPTRHLEDCIHRRHLAEEMDDDDGPGPGRNGGLDRSGSSAERHRIDVDEDRGAARIVDRPGRRKKGKARRDDFIARDQSERLQREQDRVGPAGATDAMLRVTQGGDGGLELADLTAHNEFLAFNHRTNGPGHRLFDRVVLGLQVKQGNRHVSHPRIGARHASLVFAVT